MYIYACNRSDRISVSKNINICDLVLFYGYCILVFAMLHRVPDIRIFCSNRKG